MKARFRIRTRDGRDLEPRTLEILAQLVRSGAVGPDDLVFDALTSEWAPARTHTVVRMFSDGGELPAAATDHRQSPRPVGAFGSFVVAAGGADGEPFEFDLVNPEEPSPEEAAETFIARMEQERRSDPETPELFRERPAAATKAPRGIPVRLEWPTPARTPPPSRPRLPGAPPSLRRKRARTLSGGWTLALALPAAALVASAAIVRPASDGREAVATAEASTGEPRASRPLQGAEIRLRETAYAGFVGAVEALRPEFDIEEVPEAWLQGWYLADAAGHPEVRLFWERYLAFSEEAYASEVELYRRAYLTAAERAGLSGPVRSLRMAAAVEDFEAARRDREVHYARIWDLAQSALALHDQLVHLRGRITYEPARGLRLSADPVLEAAGTDPDAQSRLEAALDRVLRDLNGTEELPREPRSGVTRWLVDGLREAAITAP
jgi:hypothetical protein